ncbi:hypothetical protein [Paraferrimonas sedimenticola]|uniref:Uncharacterized protein n=1 Tax=Paraferrimonas sedimenticola TaxID=375674 RepID=A0AA37W261_9GAMM|nr:hypothetical protein [Paraferrimonas sedimenticola]GLP97645.1 hypothetical protein GCM10007895_29520 [Paraferrimonas sedimenticola]
MKIHLIPWTIAVLLAIALVYSNQQNSQKLEAYVAQNNQLALQVEKLRSQSRSIEKERALESHSSEETSNNSLKRIQNSGYTAHELAIKVHSGEAVDPDWGPRKELLVREAVASDELLSQLGVESIDCRSRWCSIDMGGALKGKAGFDAVNRLMVTTDELSSTKNIWSFSSAFDQPDGQIIMLSRDKAPSVYQRLEQAVVN